MSKERLPLLLEVLGEQRHLRQLVLYLLTLVPVLLEDDIVAEGGDDLVDLLLRDARVILY